MSFEAKNARLALNQDRKGTPFENFLGTSRPMRSQHFELSTNQRPRFQQNIRPQPKLNPSNALPVCHCNVTVSLKIHLNQISPNGYPNMPKDCQFANAMSFEPLLCHSNHWDATQGESHFTGPSLHSTASSRDEADRSLPCIYREAADQPGPEMNSISSISQFSVTLPMDCHSDQVSVAISCRFISG